MLRNLDLITNLDIQYDASTFDTDPFEPQPDGAGTIFPFLVGNACGREYVELPYTLPQDSTLFLTLGEKNIDVWKKKLDWIAERGGLALVNTHPDYMDFKGVGRNRRSYPIEFYRKLIEYAQSRYAGQFWSALPREVAAWSRQSAAMRPVSRKRVCMVAYSFYESDNRVMRYAEALAARGDHVDVLSLQRQPSDAVQQQIAILLLDLRVSLVPVSRLKPYSVLSSSDTSQTIPPATIGGEVAPGGPDQIVLKLGWDWL